MLLITPFCLVLNVRIGTNPTLGFVRICSHLLLSVVKLWGQRRQEDSFIIFNTYLSFYGKKRNEIESTKVNGKVTSDFMVGRGKEPRFPRQQQVNLRKKNCSAHLLPQRGTPSSSLKPCTLLFLVSGCRKRASNLFSMLGIIKSVEFKVHLQGSM